MTKKEALARVITVTLAIPVRAALITLMEFDDEERVLPDHVRAVLQEATVQLGRLEQLLEVE